MNESLKRDIEYFNESSISNSDLSLLKDSPWLFRQNKDKKLDKISTDYFEMGSLIHLAILEPDMFHVADIDKPGGLMGKFLDLYIEAGSNEEAAKYAHDKSGFKQAFNTTLKKLLDPEIQEYLEFVKESEGKLILTKSQKYVIEHAQKGLERNPNACKLILDESKESDIFNEISLFGILNGIRIKGKPDRIIIDHANKKITLIDLKSTSSSPYFRYKRVHETGDLTIDYIGTGFFGSFKGYHYYRQAAFYKTLIAENYKQYFDKYSFESYIVAVNTTVSFDCSVIQLSDEWLKYGRSEVEEYINRYKLHEQENQWNYPLFDSNKGLIKL